MRGRKLVLFVAVLMVFSVMTASAQAHKLRRIGVNTFAQVKGKIPTAEVMKTIAEKYAGDIKYGFDQVGMGDTYLPFLDQLRSAAFVEKAIPVGDRFAWMLFRVRGKVMVWEDVEWAGKAPLDVFSFHVFKDNKDYEFVIPKPCGNIALYKVVEKRVIPPAVCNIVVGPAKVNLNEPVTVDMTGTKGAVRMDVEVFNAQGVKIQSHAFTAAAPKWQIKFDKPGEYLFKARAVNEDGKASDNPCQTKIVVNAPPVCKLWTSCLPCEDYVGKPITFDASGSTDPDGQVVKAIFEITDESGKVIDTFTKTDKPLVWEKIFYAPGKYGINVVVFDDMGAASSNSDPCRIAFEVTQKKFFFLVEAGPGLARGTYTGFFFARAGLMWNLAPNALDFILRIGGAVFGQGSPWKPFLMADALLNVHLGPAVYMDAGLGYTTKEQTNRLSGFDLIGAFGVNIFNNFTSAGSIFAEARIPVITTDRLVDDHYKLLLGFRYIF
ncbi:MAG: PKD domain-containing protein [Candidatus Aminicenantes bacterium]|nr:PKD domain-containing protein [Candidatus Aminicenantes bacterium]